MSNIRASRGWGIEVRAAAWVLVAAFAIAPSQARANACTEQRSAGGKFQTDSGIDPCAEYEINKKAATRQYVSSGVHAVAATMCAIECFYPYTKGAQICEGGVYVSAAADLIGSFAIKDKSEEIGAKLKSAITTVGMGIGAELLLAGGSTFEKVKKGEIKKDEKPEEKEEKDNQAKKERDEKEKKGSCKRALLQGAQSGIMFAGGLSSKNRAEKALDKKLELAAPNLPKLAGGGGGGNEQSSSAPSPSEIKTDSGSSEPIVSAKDIKESAATAEFKPLFDSFNEKTGKPVDGIFDAMANGVNPMVAAAALAGGALGPDGAAALSHIGRAAEEEARKDGTDVKLAGGVEGYERTGGGGGAKHGSDDDGTGDLSAMLAGLMPGKDGKEGAAPGAKGIQFGRAPSAVSPDGFHPASRSIFEIVDARYQAVAGRFLAGDVAPSARQPASVVPKNVYLKH